MKIGLKVIFLLFICSIIGGVYGILHDQVTMTISLEYFLYFKGLEYIELPYRIGASFIGLISTWWVGFLASILLIITLIIKRQTEYLIKTVILCCLKIMCIAAVFGIIGGIIGYLFPLENNIWLGFLFPMKISEFREFAVSNNIQDYPAFFSVWMIHCFGYIGGLVGAISQIIWIIRFKQKNG